MLAIKNQGARMWAAVLVLVWLSACTPPGPRALYKGERLIREGRHKEAVVQLQTAVRLLPTSAQAWNHLGLAYHGNQQSADAIKAYEQALRLDRNLAVVHYNLGCLLLEREDFYRAADQFTTFTLVQPQSAEGFLKLGVAEWKTRRIDQAEKHFRRVLELQQQNSEALNYLGLIQSARRRPNDALVFFNKALEADPKNAAACFNSAVLAHSQLNNRSMALDRYKQYAALQPSAANHDDVLAIVRQLDAELNPQAQPTQPSQPLLVLVPKTNPPAPAVAATHPPTRVPAVSNVSPAPVAAVVRPPAISNPPKPVAVAPAPIAPTATVAKVVKPEPKPEVKPAPTPPPPAKAQELEVTRVSDDPDIRPAQEVILSRPATVSRPASNVAARPIIAPTAETTLSDTRKTEKRGLFSRLNPFGGTRSKSTTLPAGIPTEPETRATGSTVTLPVASPPPTSSGPRYSYRSPAKPKPGNRAQAEVIFAQAVKLQKEGRNTQALDQYQRAIRSDPAYFEAYHNQGLAAYDLGNWKKSLESFEYALALKPDSIDARYNFSLGLKQAGYFQDAAAELRLILQQQPEEVRSHLTLGNLYAQRLQQPALAREHYLRVLQAEPNHPQGQEIRFWLASHP